MSNLSITSASQVAHNVSEWAQGKHVSEYDNNILSPVEVKVLVQYRDQLKARVLDLGCGAGRILSYLVMLGADAYGVDLAPKMVERCRAVVPEASVCVGDVSALKASVDGQFDVVVAFDNLIDIFDDAHRRKVLADIRELVQPGGLFIFSTHDLGWADRNRGPRAWEEKLTLGKLARKLFEKTAADAVRSIKRRSIVAANKKRLGPLQQRNHDHAIINDFSHDYSLLHYYIRRDDQERQLESIGFEMLACLDGKGRDVAPGGYGCSGQLMYVARRS
jgi:2-polyprenyl-3-methyl-5-hydroxy-6-metoxy-1,4-benzoquinol methylase